MSVGRALNQRGSAVRALSEVNGDFVCFPVYTLLKHEPNRGRRGAKEARDAHGALQL